MSVEYVMLIRHTEADVTGKCNGITTCQLLTIFFHCRGRAEYYIYTVLFYYDKIYFI